MVGRFERSRVIELFVLFRHNFWSFFLVLFIKRSYLFALFRKRGKVLRANFTSSFKPSLNYYSNMGVVYGIRWDISPATNFKYN